MKTFFYSLWEIIEVSLIALVSVFIVRTFLVQPFLVSGASMEPNFKSGDYLIIDELSYRFRTPERGEVIVFKYPGDESKFYIKRIIGLPGERVVMSGGKIMIYNNENPNGFEIKESYIPEGIVTVGDEVKLGDKEYFVMGDNRYFSSDSRFWGNLDQKEIIGLVRWRLWPFNKVTVIESPSY